MIRRFREAVFTTTSYEQHFARTERPHLIDFDKGRRITDQEC